MSSTFPAVRPGEQASERLDDLVAEAELAASLARDARDAFRTGDHQLCLDLPQEAAKPAGIIAPRVAWAKSAVHAAREALSHG